MATTKQTFSTDIDKGGSASGSSMSTMVSLIERKANAAGMRLVVSGKIQPATAFLQREVTDDAEDTGGPGPSLGHDDIVAVCGDILDWKVKAIIDIGATMAELEAARAWAAGADEVLGEERAPLSGVTAAIYDILIAGEEFDGDRQR